MKKTIYFLFGILFFLTPLILWPFTSEVFELNKIVLTYILTSLITATWIGRMIVEKKFIIRRTILDIPLLVFLFTQLLSTIFSMNFHTSLFGYYSRFNGGLLSIISYSLLYWAFVSNIDKKQTVSLIKWFIGSAVIVSIYGILEHFGIDKNVWVQDVENRIFSTLGQPNWLAAFLVGLIPLTWTKIFKKPYNFILSALFFITLLFTKSRSGILAFLVADVIFWGLNYLKERSKVLKSFLYFNAIFLVLFFLIKTPFTLPKSQTETTTPAAPALEVGGTESGEIRKIVWKGALDVFLHNPIVGSGLETFAYSYNLYRPVEHNLVSEWDFIYNKAHNEFLNIAAGSGLLGILSYLVLISFGAFLLYKKERYELLAGYVGISITNFFGFSVVVTQLQLFLLPAIAISLGIDPPRENKPKKENIDGGQRLSILFTYFLALLLVYSTLKFWRADTLFMKAKSLNRSNGDLVKTQEYITRAIKLNGAEAQYHIEMANTYVRVAIIVSQSDEEKDKLPEIEKLVETYLDKALSLSPNDVNIKKVVFSAYIRLSVADSKYLVKAASILEEAIKEAPTDAKLYYNLGLSYARLGRTDDAFTNLKKAIDLKSNYKEARLAYAFLLIDKKENTEAKAQLEYILTNIDPNDETTKQQLEELK